MMVSVDSSAPDKVEVVGTRPEGAEPATPENEEQLDEDQEQQGEDEDTPPEPDDPPGPDTPAPDTGVPAGRGRSWRKILWGMGGFLAAVILGVCATITWQALNHDDQLRSEVTGTQNAPDPRNTGTVTSTDDETRFRISFPASWATRKTGGADVRLVAGPGGGDLMSVRVVSLDTGAGGPPTLTGIKPYLDTIVNEPGVTVLQQSQTQMSGLPGWYYVYSFKDPETGQQGVHAQYFVIRGNQLYSIVFQALPAADFPRLAPSYQQVADTMQFF